MFEQATATSFRGYEGHLAATAISQRSVAFTEQALGAQLRFGKHRSVFLAGDEADRLFEVQSGAVMVYRILDDGRRQVVEVIFAGGICGLSSSGVHESCCETLMPSVLRAYKRADVAKSESLRMRVMERLQSQVCAMHDHTVSLGRKTAEERICTLILRLGSLESSAGQTGQCEFTLPLSRTEIADYLGLTLETVCRTLTDLQRRGFLEIGSKRTAIKITSLRKLRELACVDDLSLAA